MVVRLDDDRARVDGRASVDELGELWDDLDVDALLEDRDEYDTLGGLMFHRIGGVPKPGDQIRVGELILTVETTDGRRASKVLAVRERPRRWEATRPTTPTADPAAGDLGSRLPVSVPTKKLIANRVAAHIIT